LGFLASAGTRRASYLYFHVPTWFHIVFVGLAATIGLVFGFRGITWLLGHLFMTHFDNQKSQATTIAIWAVLLSAVALAYRLAN
jgi:hypothetical protein